MTRSKTRVRRTAGEATPADAPPPLKIRVDERTRVTFDPGRRSIPQGDCLLIPIRAVPETARGQVLAPEGRHHVIAHSETGHHHVIEARGDIRHFGSLDRLRAFLEVGGPAPAELKHLRDHHRHETQIVPAGAWLVQRQRAWRIGRDKRWDAAID